MEKSEIIRRLEKIARHAVHFVGEKPFVMSLDDGIAVSEVLELLKEQEPKAVLGLADSIEGIEVGKCPRCDRTIVNKKSDPTWFCKYCGQAVTWHE